MIGLKEAIILTKISTYGDKNFIYHKDKIEECTGIGEEEQKDILNTLRDLGLLIKIDAEHYRVDTKKVMGYFGVCDETTIENIKVRATKKSSEPKMSKQEGIRLSLLKKIKTTNEELLEAYSNWIEGMIAKKGYLTGAQVQMFEEAIDNYCNHDLDKALAVIRIGIMKGLIDAQWCITDYEKQISMQPSYAIKNNITPINTEPVRLSKEVF